MDDRQALNRGGATHAGARAVVVPARLGITHERPARHTVVGEDGDTFSLDDGHTYCKLSGTLWEERHSVHRGTTLVRNAYTEGSFLFDGVWKSARDPAVPTPDELRRARERFIVGALHATRRVAPWADADPHFDVRGARRELEAIHEDLARIPAERFWAVVEKHRRDGAPRRR